MGMMSSYKYTYDNDCLFAVQGILWDDCVLEPIFRPKSCKPMHARDSLRIVVSQVVTSILRIIKGMAETYAC